LNPIGATSSTRVTQDAFFDRVVSLPRFDGRHVMERYKKNVNVM